MNERRAVRISAAALLACIIAIADVANAATTGIAYDSVQRISLGTSLDPKTFGSTQFDADFQTALQQMTKKMSTPQPTSEQSPLVPPASSRAARVYVTPSKQRTDYPATNSAQLVDCDARTVAILDLSAKTYIMRSFDDPFPEFTAPGDEAASMKKTKYSVAIETRAFGTKRLGNVDTAVYQATSTMTLSSSPVTATTTKSAITRYYSKFRVPKSKCPGFEIEGNGAQFLQWRTSARSKRFDPNYSDRTNPNIKATGPGLPDRLPLLEIARYDTGVGGGAPLTVSSVNEVGHIRRITSGDHAFVIPSDFKPLGSTKRVTPTSRVKHTATVGIAYDSVAKTGSTIEPLDFSEAAFERDFKAAKQPELAIFDHAAHVYLTATKQRTDILEMNYASIVDCEAKTITTLDLAKRTYKLSSFAEVRAEWAALAPGWAPTDGRLSIALANRFLGLRRLGNANVPA